MPQAFAAAVITAGAQVIPIAIPKFFIYAAATFAINAATKALAPKPPKGAGRGNEVNYAETDAPGVLLYGTARLGGMHTIPPVTSGSENQDLHQVLTHCYGGISDIRDVYFDDDTIADADIGAVTGADTDGVVGGSTKYAGFAWIRRYLGTTSDNVDFILNAVSGTSFPSSFRGRRIAKTAIRLRFNDKVYASLPLVNVLADGYAVYDPRLDSTKAGGSGAHRDNDSTTWAFAGGLGSNPALCLAHFLMNTEYGGGYLTSEIDWSTFQTAATACDALVNIPGALTQPRYTCNGILLANADFTVNVARFTDAMLGRVQFRDGQWRAHAGGWATPTFTVDRHDFTGPVSIKFEGGRDSRYNRTRCWFVDSSLKYSRKECYPRTNAAYVTADGAETIDIEMEQPLCVNEFEAQRKAEFILRQSRNQIIVSAEVGPKLSSIALWETGVINWDEFDWSSKTFRCVGVDVSETGGLRLTFREEQEDDWDDLAAGDYNNPSTAAVPVANETRPSAPVSFAVANSLNGTLTFSIGESVVQPVGTRYRVIRGLVSSNAAVGTVVYEGTWLRGDLPSAIGTHYYWAQAYVPSVPTSPSGYTPNTTGIGAAAQPYVTDDLAPNAATFVTMANCITTRTFSKGAGAFLGQELGRVDFAIQSYDADVVATAVFRAGLGNIFATNGVLLQFVTGVTSSYLSPTLPNGGTTAEPRPTTLQRVFTYTRGNSSYVALQWDTTSGPNSMVMDNLNLQVEFIRR